MTLTSPDQSTDINANRRDFIKYLLGFSVFATLGGVLVPVVGYLWPPTRRAAEQGGQVKVASLAELQTVGGMVVPAEDQPIVLTFSERASVKAFSAVCTHLGCVVEWENAGFIQCPCHEGRFSAQTGAVISGPPPSPLSPRDVVVDGDDIYVSL